MKPALKFLGLGAACVACCSLPAAGSLLVGLGLGGLGAASLGWAIGLAVLAGAVLALVMLLRRRPADACAVTATGCGCAGPKLAAPSSPAD